MAKQEIEIVNPRRMLTSMVSQLIPKGEVHIQEGLKELNLYVMLVSKLMTMRFTRFLRNTLYVEIGYTLLFVVMSKR